MVVVVVLMVIVIVVVVVAAVVVVYHNLCSEHAEAAKIFYTHILKTCIHVQYFPFRI
jgi:hypothetical protein